MESRLGEINTYSKEWAEKLVFFNQFQEQDLSSVYNSTKILVQSDDAYI